MEYKLLINYIIMGLYVVNVVYSACFKDWFQVWYWFAAFNITAAVTFAR